MQKSSTKAVHILAAGALLLGNCLAQDAPAATTPRTSSNGATSNKDQTPAAKRPAAAAKTAAPVTLNTSKEKFSYALGMRMGASLHKQEVPGDANILARGLKDSLAGGKTLLTDQEAQAAIVEVRSEEHT